VAQKWANTKACQCRQNQQLLNQSSRKTRTISGKSKPLLAQNLINYRLPRAAESHRDQHSCRLGKDMASQQKAIVNQSPTPKSLRPSVQALSSAGAIQTSENHRGVGQRLTAIVPKRQSGPYSQSTQARVVRREPKLGSNRNQQQTQISKKSTAFGQTKAEAT
jgi:hypothetical protein